MDLHGIVHILNSILCQAGDFYVWDRVSAVLLYHIRPKAVDVGGDLTCVAWNSAVNEPLMLATGSQIGQVRIWLSGEPTEVATQ